LPHGGKDVAVDSVGNGADNFELFLDRRWGWTRIMVGRKSEDVHQQGSDASDSVREPRFGICREPLRLRDGLFAPTDIHKRRSAVFLEMKQPQQHHGFAYQAAAQQQATRALWLQIFASFTQRKQVFVYMYEVLCVALLEP